MSTRPLVAGLALVAAVLGSSPSRATTVTYRAIDLPDTAPGEDLWEYRYAASGFDFDEGFGFSIFFNFLHYAQLESSPAAVHPDWDIITLQPDPNLPDDGVYDALALVDNASVSHEFHVRFEWLGGGFASPPSQAFVIYEPGFGTIETGFTLFTFVPEPTVATLMLACIVVVAGLCRQPEGRVRR